MLRLAPPLTTLAIALLTSGTAPAQQWSTDKLSVARSMVAAVTVDNFVLVAGGTYLGSPSDVVDIYDTVTGTWTVANLSVPRHSIGAASLGHLAFFAGGGEFATPMVTDVVDIFDAQTMTWSTHQLSQPRGLLAAATVGTKVLFAGGGDFTPSVSDVVDIYDASVGPPNDPNAWTTTVLSQARAELAAVTVGDQVLFAGGADWQDNFYADVDIYDDSTGIWTTTQLSGERAPNWMASASVGTCAFFAGGRDTTGMSSTVDIYDAQTQSWTSTTLSLPRATVAATAVGDRVLFAGGGLSPADFNDTVDVYNASTGQWEAVQYLSQARLGIDAVTIDGKAMFFGGQDSQFSVVDTIDIYDPLGGCDVTKYCDSSQNPNNTALIDIDTCDSAGTSIRLSLSNGPSNQFTYLLVGNGNGTVSQPPGSNGDLCVVGGSCLGRYDKDIGKITDAGTFSVDILSATSNPCAGGVNIDPGATWNFQFWHRQPMGSPSTFSQALQVTFQ